METKSIVQVTVAVLVAVLVFTTILVPVVSSFEKDRTYTYINAPSTSAQVMAADLHEFGPEDTATIDMYILAHWQYSISYNGAEGVPGEAYAVNVASDGFIIRPYETNFGMPTAIQNVPNAYPYSDTLAVHVEIANNMATITYGDWQGNSHVMAGIPITWIAVPNPDGDYIIGTATNHNKTLYYNDIDNVRGANWLTTTNEWYSFVGRDVTIGGQEITADIENEKTVAGNGHSIVYASTIGDYTFTVDNAGEDYTVHPYVYVAPREVVAITEMDSATAALLNVIPIVVIVGLILSVVGVAIVRRYDL